MEASELIGLAKKFAESKQFITNEESTKMALIVPFLRLLGYEPNSPREVRPEYQGDFIVGDGKKHPDRMDYAIFDSAGEHARFVIEAKALGTDLKSKSHQLARYIAQEPQLNFGIMTDGCQYLFYGDLDNPNVMDGKPFFSFSLADEKEDWARVAAFLRKFSRDAFNADTLVTDAEDNRYRREMIDRLAAALENPKSDEKFMLWLTEKIYKGKRTTAVKDRLSVVAAGAVEAALRKVVGKSVLETLKGTLDPDAEPSPAQVENEESEEERPRADGIVTTKEELEFHRIAQSIVALHGFDAEEVLYKDTRSYFNVSYRRPTKWFLRWFGDAKTPHLTCLVPATEAKRLAGRFRTEQASDGSTKVYLAEIQQLWALQELVVLSLNTMLAPKKAERTATESDDSQDPDGTDG